MLRWLVFVPLTFVAACSPEQPEPSQHESSISASAPMPVARAEYRYTRLDDCELLRSAPDEAGFYEYECDGAGGYRLRLIESDLREDITVLPSKGGEAPLGLSALANGAFSSVGETVEWRGAMEGARFAPHGLILRQSVMEDPDPQVPEVSYLLAVRLGDAPCVVARIPPGANQNERARNAADADGKCLRGR